MKWTTMVLIFFAMTIVFSSCATQRYGRLQRVTEAERNYLTCKNIEVEIEKAQEFTNETTEKDNEFTGRDVLAFLGDFGIGNSLEFSDAIKSGTDRLKDLNALKAEKGCTTTTGFNGGHEKGPETERPSEK